MVLNLLITFASPGRGQAPVRRGEITLAWARVRLVRPRWARSMASGRRLTNNTSTKKREIKKKKRDFFIKKIKNMIKNINVSAGRVT